MLLHSNASLEYMYLNHLNGHCMVEHCSCGLPDLVCLRTAAIDRIAFQGLLAERGLQASRLQGVSELQILLVGEIVLARLYLSIMLYLWNIVEN